MSNQDESSLRDIDELHTYIQSLEHMLSQGGTVGNKNGLEVNRIKEQLVIASAVYRAKCDELNINPDGKSV